MGFFDNLKKATSEEGIGLAKQFIQQHSNPVNPPKEEKETFANDSGGRDEGGGGGGSNPVNPVGTIGQGGTAFKTGTVSDENNNAGSGAGVSDSVADAMKAQQEAVAQKQQEQEQARQQAEAQRQAAEAIRRQQEAMSQPAGNVNDAMAQADANVSAIQEQLNIAKNNNSTEDILRLTEDLLQAQRMRDELDAQARAVASKGTTSLTNPLVGAPQTVDNEYAQSATVGASNPLANNFATSLRPNDTRSSAFVKNAGRVVRDEEEDEFWTGGNPLREAIDRVNSGNPRATDITVGRPVNGVTQPTSVYDVNPTLRFSGGNPNPQPGITRDQFLEATSNLLSPIANFGVRPAEGSFPYHPNVVPVGTTLPTETPQTPGWVVQDAQNEARKNAELARARQVMANADISPEARAYMDEYGLDPEWLLTPAGQEIRRDLPNNPLRAGEQFNEALPGTNSFADAVTKPSGNGGYSWNDVWNDTQRLADNALMSTMFGPTATSLLNISPTVRDNFLAGLGNLGRGVDDYQAQVAEFGKTSDKVLADAITEIAADPDNPTDAELAEASKLAGERLKEMDIRPEFQPVSANGGNTGNRNPNNTQDNFSPAYPGAKPNPNQNPFASLQSFNVTDNPENYADNTMRDIMGNRTFAGLPTFNLDDPFQTITPEDNKKLQGIYEALPEFWSEGEKGQYLYDAYNNPKKGTVYAPDPGIIASMAPPSIDENGNPNYTLELLGRVDDKGRPIYDADTVFQAFADTSGEAMKDGGQVAWKQPVQDLLNDPTLTPEERAGLNAILVNNWWAGDPKLGRDLYPRQFFDGTDAQYERLADLLSKKLGLDYLMDQGVVNDTDVANFFLKAPAGAEGNPLAGESGNGKPQTLPASYGQGDKVVKAPYRKGGYSAAELEAMGNSPYKDYRGYDAYEGYYRAPDGHWYPVDQEKANYYNRYGTYRGWDEGMRDYYNTFGTFSGYTPNWRNTGKKSSGGGRSYYRGGNSYSRNGSYSGSSYSSNYQPYSYSNSSSTPQYANQQRAMVSPNTATQRSNRVYNIMKNWSF